MRFWRISGFCSGSCRFSVFGIFLLVVLALPFPLKAQGLRDLAIEGQDGVAHHFQVEVALTPAQRAKGLMFRRELAPNVGMLFDFGRAQDVAMWMKNTLLPLDMFFVDGDGRVVNIAERTIPGSLTPIPADGPVRYVIELNGGTAAKLHLKAGDRVVAGLSP